MSVSDPKASCAVSDRSSLFELLPKERVEMPSESLNQHFKCAISKWTMDTPAQPVERETRGSSSSQPVRTSYNEDLEEIGVIELGRESDVCPSQYPCYEFLHAAGIYGEVTNLITSAGLSKIVLEERPQYVKLTKMFVQNFNFIDDQYHPRVEFMLYERPCSMLLSEFCRAIGVLDRSEERRVGK